VAAVSPLSAFGGGPLQGTKLVRIAYLDETGISRDERFALVSAVIFHGDNWQSVRNGLSELADHCAPPQKRDGFIFHAKEIHNGGKTFDRQIYPPAVRRDILKALLHIPADNRMLVAYGWIDKRSYRNHPMLPSTERDRGLIFHAIAFCQALIGVERVMRERFPNECVQLVVENNSDHRKVLKEVYRFLGSEESVELLSPDTLGWLPLRHVIDTPNFVEKTESSPLQLADAVAFALKHYLERTPYGEEYLEPLKGALTMLPKMELVEE
jgi:hypothetical protein